jgi:transcriptional regulator with PAS, ATPase and Fis domain
VGEFRRVGGNKTLRSDVRIIAATNKNLEDEIKRGRFREDLYYRLNVLNIIILPLRERKKDIKALANHFLDKYMTKVGKTFNTIDQRILSMLQQYDWPGNVRELENVIERAVIICDSGTITTEDFVIPSRAAAESDHELPPLKEVEKEYILRVLKKTGGNRSRASKLLGLDRKTLYMKLKKYGLEH